MQRLYWGIRGLLCITILSCLACAHHPSVDTFPSYEVRQDSLEDQIRVTTEAYQLASQAKKRSDKAAFAKKGIIAAERCAEIAPKDAACYFYLALNTGLHTEAKVLGYPKAIRRIAKAAETVTKLDPSYEDAGGYRILGKLYQAAPAFGISKHSIRRDLDKSRFYLEKAVSIAPGYPENHLFLAETLIKLDDKAEARQHLEEARQLIAAGDYPMQEQEPWDHLLLKLDKKVAN